MIYFAKPKEKEEKSAKNSSKDYLRPCIFPCQISLFLGINAQKQRSLTIGDDEKMHDTVFLFALHVSCYYNVNRWDYTALIYYITL